MVSRRADSRLRRTHRRKPRQGRQGGGACATISITSPWADLLEVSQASCYRAHNPKWAFSPLSGDGAKIHGGRFNPRGVSALYLGLTIEGAIVESLQGFASKLEPLTVCLYEVDCEDIVDLSTPETRDGLVCAGRHGMRLGARPAEWRKRPASWRVRRNVDRARSAGVLVPSFARSARRRHAQPRSLEMGPGPSLARDRARSIRAAAEEHAVMGSGRLTPHGNSALRQTEIVASR